MAANASPRPALALGVDGNLGDHAKRSAGSKREDAGSSYRLRPLFDQTVVYAKKPTFCDPKSRAKLSSCSLTEATVTSAPSLQCWPKVLLSVVKTSCAKGLGLVMSYPS